MQHHAVESGIPSHRNCQVSDGLSELGLVRHPCQKKTDSVYNTATSQHVLKWVEYARSSRTGSWPYISREISSLDGRDMKYVQNIGEKKCWKTSTYNKYHDGDGSILL
jgi:hypothetical protein